jgi:hypothetical protein
LTARKKRPGAPQGAREQDEDADRQRNKSENCDLLKKLLKGNRSKKDQVPVAVSTR